MAGTLSGMRTNVRRRIQDLSTVSPGLTDAIVNQLINDANRWWHVNMEKRLERFTLVASYGAGSAYETSGATATNPEINSVCHLSAGVDRPLERMEWNELLQQQLDDATQTTTPRFYALHKLTGGTGSPLGDENRWRVGLWPIPSGAVVIVAYGRREPTALSADADEPDLGDFEVMCVENIAGYWGGMLLDRPDLADMCMKLLPQMVQDKLAAERKRLDPVRRPEEQAA